MRKLISKKKIALLGVLVGHHFLCLVLGGASVWPLGHQVLHFFAALGLGVLLLSWPSRSYLGALKTPIGGIVALIVIGILQLIPLPVPLWSSLPGRESILDGFRALNVTPTPLPMSLDPEATISTFGYALTPLFVMLLTVRIGLKRLSVVFPIVLCGSAVLMVIFGLAQVSASSNNILYIYDDTNFGSPVGTFAAVNHAGTFLLMTVPFAILLLRNVQHEKFGLDHRLALTTFTWLVLLLLLVGIAAAGSLAIYCLLLPTAGFSFLAIQSSKRSIRTFLNTVPVFILILSVGVAIVSTSPILDGLGATDISESATSRGSTWAYTIDAIKQYWPIGSGLGSYRNVIPQFENSELVSSTYIAMAHNEYLQLIMETGIMGAILFVFLMIWLLNRSRAVFFAESENEQLLFKKMALIGVYVCVFHSFIDYPLRTPAIASLLSFLITIVALPGKNRTAVFRGHAQKSKRLVL